MGKIDRKHLSDEIKRAILDNTGIQVARQYPLNAQKRRYNPKWETEFTWLRYSPSIDGAYCACCFLFCTKTNDPLITFPFRDWKNALGSKRGILPNHEISKTHQSAMLAAEKYLAVSRREKSSILETLSKSYSTSVEQNRRALLIIVDVIFALARRGIAFRGRWDKLTHKENGNFEFFIRWLAKYESNLAKHLETAPKNATYLSPQIQNELIQCIGDSIREVIVDKISKSKFISVMADETSDVSMTEQLSVCIRYLDRAANEKVEIEEAFLGFVDLPRTDAATITAALLQSLVSWGINLDRLRGMGFDGVSTMSGSVSGVQARITSQHPKAKYFTHCSSHCLNLVIVASCTNVQEIQNFMTTFKEITLFFTYSSKRKFILKKNLDKDADDLLADCTIQDHEESLLSSALHRHTLPTLSDTRWLSRVDSISCLLVNFKNIYEALIEVQEQSTAKASHDASAFMHSMEQFSFIMAAVLTQYTLGYSRPLSVLLQSKTCDLLAAHQEARNLVKVTESIRNEEKFKLLYERATQVADTIGVQPSKPRSVSRQTHRANVPSTSVSEYYRLNYYYPFLDHIITHMNKRFPDSMENALLGTYLVPSNIRNLTPSVIEKIKSEFSGELPMPYSFNQEVNRWKIAQESNTTSSLSDAVCMCNEVLYPNISTILQLILTLPVGSCSCERSFSSLRRLKTWCRSTMCEDRLNGISLAFIHQNIIPEPMEVLKKWDASGHRRIALAFAS